jgi:hypothetical protein
MNMYLKRIAGIAFAVFALSMLGAAPSLAEEAGADRIECFPLLQYEQLFLDDRPVASPSIGVIANPAPRTGSSGSWSTPPTATTADST